jgi:hypothetical protein
VWPLERGRWSVAAGAKTGIITQQTHFGDWQSSQHLPDPMPDKGAREFRNNDS